MENIGQLAATIFGFGLAFYAIWLHYDGDCTQNNKNNLCFKLLFFVGEVILVIVFLLLSCPFFIINIGFAWIGLLIGTILIIFSIIIIKLD